MQEHCFSPIILWTDGEVQPDGAVAILLNEDLVIVLLRLIGVVHQDHCIPHRLLNASDPDIHCASRQMIARRRPSTFLFSCGLR